MHLPLAYQTLSVGGPCLISTVGTTQTIRARCHIRQGSILYDEPLHYLLNDRAHSTSDDNYQHAISEVSHGMHRSLEMAAFLIKKLGIERLSLYFGGTSEYHSVHDSVSCALISKLSTHYQVNTGDVERAYAMGMKDLCIHLPGSSSYEEEIKHTIFQTDWVSLVDHACNPNAMMLLVETDVHDSHFSMTPKVEYRLQLVAMCDIDENEMITRSYTTSSNVHLLPFCVRGELLFTQAGIESCRCRACAIDLRTPDVGGVYLSVAPVAVYGQSDAKIPVRPCFPYETYFPELSESESNGMETLFSCIRDTDGLAKGAYIRRLTIIQWTCFYFAAYGREAIAGVDMRDITHLRSQCEGESDMWTKKGCEATLDVLAAFRTFPSVYTQVLTCNNITSLVYPLHAGSQCNALKQPAGFRRWPRLVLRNYSNLFKMLVLQDWSEFSQSFVENLSNITAILICVIARCAESGSMREPVISSQLVILYALCQLRIHGTAFATSVMQASADSRAADTNSESRSCMANVLVDALIARRFIDPILIKLKLTSDFARSFYQSMKLVHPSLDNHLKNMLMRK